MFGLFFIFDITKVCRGLGGRSSHRITATATSPTCRPLPHPPTPNPLRLPLFSLATTAMAFVSAVVPLLGSALPADPFCAAIQASPLRRAGRPRRRAGGVRGAPPLPPSPAPVRMATPLSTPVQVLSPAAGDRTARVRRVTGETTVVVEVNLDGTGVADVASGMPFLDHMLCQLCSHGLLDLHVRADGDHHIDDHHTNEDVGITLGMALGAALGAKAGIVRFGQWTAPLDEALVEVVLDFSGRGGLFYTLPIPTERIGTYDTQLVREFLGGLAGSAGLTLHVRRLAGINSHHIVEAAFKALARALRGAVAVDPRRAGAVPSSKGVLTDGAAVQAD